MEEELLGDLFDGVWLIPLLLSLKSGEAKVFGQVLSGLEDSTRSLVEGYWLERGWLQEDEGSQAPELTELGQFIWERIDITATVASYRPMLNRMDDLLGGDCATVFARDA